LHWAFKIRLRLNYLLQTYIVTSKPKRISVATGVVHMMILLLGLNASTLMCLYEPNYTQRFIYSAMRNT